MFQTFSVANYHRFSSCVSWRKLSNFFNEVIYKFANSYRFDYLWRCAVISAAITLLLLHIHGICQSMFYNQVLTSTCLSPVYLVQLLVVCRIPSSIMLLSLILLWSFSSLREQAFLMMSLYLCFRHPRFLLPITDIILNVLSGT